MITPKLKITAIVSTTRTRVSFLVRRDGVVGGESIDLGTFKHVSNSNMAYIGNCDRDLLKQNAISTAISTHVTPRQEDGLKSYSPDSTHCWSWSRCRYHLCFTASRRTVQQRTLRLGSHIADRIADRQDQ